MNSFALELRQAARAALPEAAFLRRDRGDGLFVTDAPRRCPDGGWRQALREAGFAVETRDGLARLSPAPTWLKTLEARFPEPPDALCASLFRFAGRAPEAESLRLFALGARTLDGEGGDERFDRALRQRAAECLRLNGIHPEGPTLGGGLYACALLHYLIEEER
ncbi:MAG: hypothetical protein Q4C10_05435 [Clostridia bacterium]|nr:hypothetical protein [Clostridia bacterium]